MNLPRFSVRNPVPVNFLMIGVIVLGAISMVTLKREFFPNIEAEQILITVPYPGATPAEIERSVTRVIEREIEDVEGIEEIRSSIFEGVTLIVAKLEDGTPRDRALNDIRGEMDKVLPDLPDDAEEPQVAEQRPLIPAIAVVVSGPVSELRLHEAARAVRDDLLDIESVTEVQITGIRAREYVIEIEPARLEALGLTFEQAGRALASLNLDVPGGQLKGERYNIRVRTVGERRLARELEEQVILTSGAGRVVRLRDLGRVRPAFEDRTEYGRFRDVQRDGVLESGDSEETHPGRSALINIFKSPEQDAVRIATDVRAYVQDNPTREGGAIKLSTTTDLSRIIEGRIDLMARNAKTGLLLVLLVLAIFLEIRIAFWVAVGLAFSFLGTFLLMDWTGQSINLISLFGLIVVLGLIVDDAIVIGENIFSVQRSGVPPLLAAEQGAKEVGVPVVAAVLTTCAAFAPLAFMGGRIGDFLGVLPPVVICALGLSLVEAFLILPGHLSHTMRAQREGTPPWWRRVGLAIRSARHRFFEGILPNLLEKSLRLMLPWRYVVVAFAISTLTVAFGLVAGGLVPFVLIQDTDAESVTATLEMAAGTPEQETVRTLRRIESLASKQPEVRTIFTVLGSSFSDRGKDTAADPATVGQLVLELYPAEERKADNRRTSLEVVNELRQRTKDLTGVRKLSFKSQGGGPGGPDIEIRVRAEELEVLEQGVKRVREALVNYVGVSEIFDDLQLGKLEARLSLAEPARIQGMTTRDVALQVRHALFGFEAQDLQVGDEEVTVRAMLPESARTNLRDLSMLRLAMPDGGRMPLEEAVTFRMERGYAALARVDGKRAATIRAEVDDSVANTAQVNADLQKEFANISEEIPGVSLSFEGARKETNESVGSLKFLFPVALMFIYGIIAILFRSYLQPVIVMLAIPFAIGGAIVGHAVMAFPFTILSMIGVVALAGIVVNDGLILVDLANRLRRKGADLEESVIGAARGRMRAILLTSITTCAGLAPLMLEQSFQAQFLIPMAVSIVFGLAFATMIILILIPLLYTILEDLRACVRWIFGSPWSRHMAYDPILHADEEAGSEG
jgi:multidrug efflux pump subunit AcrB